VALRGDVLALRKPIGFLPNARLERFVVLQADRVTAIVETAVVAPLDDALPMYSSMPGALLVAASEAGARKKQVALLTQIMTLPLERFEVSAVGKFNRVTRVRMDEILRLVLSL
jgi:mRNA-degrading endonuclease toxin of MazEF toxin-antitoxin module